MAKHLFYSDVHMKRENLRWCRIVFEAIERGAEEHGVIASGGYVVNGGDLFNERGVIPTCVLDELAITRRRWADKGIKCIDNLGNHDLEDREGKTHPLRIFAALPGTMVVDRPTFVEGVRWWFFPYSHKLKSHLFEHAVRNARPHQCCFVHAGVRMAFRSAKNQDTDGLDIDELGGFKRVFSGHYHYRQEIGNLTYIGSTMQHTLAEAGQDKGFLIYDDAKDKVVFHAISGTPRFHEAVVEWTGKKWELTGKGAVGADDTVMFRVRGPGERVRAMTREKLVELVPAANIKIDRDVVDETVSRLALDEKDHGDLGSLMGKYVDHLDPALDRSRLLKLGLELAGM